MQFSFAPPSAQAFGCGSPAEFQDGQTKVQGMLNVPERFSVYETWERGNQVI
jgi:hypothetical protein